MRWSLYVDLNEGDDMSKARAVATGLRAVAGDRAYERCQHENGHAMRRWHGWCRCRTSADG